MGMLALQQLMSLQRRRGSIASVRKRKASPCDQDGDGGSQACKRMRCSIPDLPEDIWHYIHSLMPLRDAARVACLSRAFLHSWRCHPNLSLSRDTVGSSDKIDHILRNHSGHLKVLKLGLDGISCRYLDSWLHIAVTAGIEEFTLMPFRRKYNVPSSLFSDGVRNSIQYLELGFCTFRPTAELGPLRSLTSLHLRTLRITGDELECLLSKALALEQLVIIDCKEIICLKLSCTMPNLETLVLSSDEEVVNTPILPTKFLYLKHLTIDMVSGLSFSPSYDYFSLVSFLLASPSLETLILNVTQQCMEHESAVGGSSHLRKMPEHQHCCLKSVKIIGFSSAKGLVLKLCGPCN
ncbi:unnamed protein product [Urochloa decumbens]|uniref:F-box domain-containing protein n=1 Tax=Urochloa decumbens TaxID=240449 RepID=A0ABC9BXJ5_9POAL